MKLLKYIIYAIISLLVLVAVVTFLYKDEAIDIVQQEIKDQSQFNIELSDIDVSIFKSFPSPSVNLHGLVVTGIDTFSTDTLANIKEASLQFNLLSVLKNSPEILINKLQLTDPQINVKTLKNGLSNIDPLLVESDEEETKTGEKNFVFQGFEIQNGTIDYNDFKEGNHISIHGLEHESSGDFRDAILTMNTSTQVDNMHAITGGSTIVNNWKLDLDLPVKINQPESKYHIDPSLIHINDLEVEASGDVQLQDKGQQIALNLSSKKSDVKSVIGLINGYDPKLLDGIDSRGEFGLDVELNGLLSETTIPGYQVKVDISDGYLKSKEAPYELKSINTNATISNDTGDPSKYKIDIPSLDLLMDDDPIHAKVQYDANQRDPFFDIIVDGKLDLSKYLSLIDTENSIDLKGVLNLDAIAKGNLSALKSEQYEKIEISGKGDLTGFAAAAEGMNVSLDAAAFDYKNDELNLPKLTANINGTQADLEGSLQHVLANMLYDHVLNGKINIDSPKLDFSQITGESNTSATEGDYTTIPNVDVDVSAKAGSVLYEEYTLDDVTVNANLQKDKLIIKNFTGKLGKSDLDMSGEVQNLEAFVNDKGTLSGLIKLKSQNLDYSDLPGSDAPAGNTAPEPLELPQNLDLDVQVDARKVTYEDTKLSNVQGILEVGKSRVNFENLSASIYGGDFKTNGYFSTENNGKPTFSLENTFQNLNYLEPFQDNKFIRTIAPLFEIMEGKFNSNINISGVLDENLELDYNTLSGGGFVETISSFVRSTPTLDKIGSYLNLQHLDKWSLKDLNHPFKIQDGALVIEPFDMAITGVGINVGGKHFFNQNMDYIINASIPRELLEKSKISGQLLKETDALFNEINKRGLNIESGKYVDVRLLVGGSIKKPEIRVTQVKVADTPITDQIKNQITEKVNEKTEELKDTVNKIVRNETEKIQKEVDKKTEEIKDSIRSRVENEIEKAKESAGQKVSDEVKEKIADSVKAKIAEQIESSNDSISTKVKEELKEQLEKFNPFKKKKN